MCMALCYQLVFLPATIIACLFTLDTTTHPTPTSFYVVVVLSMSLKDQLDLQEVPILFVSVCGTGEGSVTTKWRLGSR